MKTSIRLRFLLPFSILLILSLAGLALYFVDLARKTYVTRLEADLFANARLVADQVTPFLIPPMDYTELDILSHRLSPLVGARITIVKPDGIVVGESDANANVMENHLTRPEIKAAVGGREDAETRFSSTVHKNFLYAAVPVRSEKAIIGVVRLAVPLTQLEEMPAAIRRATLNVTLMAILLGILLSLIISRFALSPLTGLNRAVKAFADGKLSHPHLPVSNDEVGLLNQAFMRMATDLRSQFEELKTEQASLSAVLAQMTDGVIIVDAGGSVRLINPAAERLFQQRPKTSVGQSLIEVVRHYQIVDAWRQSLAAGVQQSVTLEVAAEKIFLHVVATPLVDLLPGSTLLLFQDLTRVRRLETVRQDFISNVSHELRTPLAAMKALTETLQEGALDDPPAAQGFLGRMNGEIDTMAQLVQELLELTRIESGRAPLQKVSFNPGEILQAAAERIRLQAERAALALVVNVPDKLPSIRVDRGRIEQVLVNILHNAVKFTPAGGKIQAEVQSSDGGVIFSIRDTGPGIPEEDLERIFERFYKRDKARSGGGTGLGLSVAKRIVEAHGGRIWAESQPGAGSVFYFYIPS